VTPVEIKADGDPAFVPLQELQNLACGRWHFDAIAVLPRRRRRNEAAHAIVAVARAAGCAEISPIDMSRNKCAPIVPALGIRRAGAVPIFGRGMANSGADAILLCRTSRE
jgi:hypothetical protein